MTGRRAARLLGALLAAAAAASAPASVAAQEVVLAQASVPDKDKKDKEARRVAELRSVAADFELKNVAALLARVPEDAKLSLALGDTSGEFAVDQAREVLTKYFEGFQKLTVTFVKSEGNVGSFDIVLRKRGKDKEQKLTLTVTIGKPVHGKFPLLRLAVE